MPAKPPTSEDHACAWHRASGDYARTVAIRGTGSPEAREAWTRANEILDELVKVKFQELRADGFAAPTVAGVA